MLSIIKAIKRGELHYLVQLVAEGNTDWIQTPFEFEDGYSAFTVHYAAQYGQLSILQFLLEQQPDVLNTTDGLNHTSLSYAVLHGHLSVIEYLVNNGAALDGKYNEYPLMYWAMWNKHYEIVLWLIEYVAEIDMQWGDRGSHLIHRAASAGQKEIVRSLLKKNPNLLDLKNTYDETPVLCAATHGHNRVVSYLISKGADLNIASNRSQHRDDRGKTAIAKALDGEHYDCVLEMAAKQGKSTLFSYIKSGRQALELMSRDSDFISPFLHNSIIFSLLKETDGCNITKKSIVCYNKSNRRRSSKLIQINIPEKVSCIFEYKRHIGEGGYGIVRTFQDADGQEIAVKSPKEDRSNRISALANEARCQRIAYPNDNMLHLFEFFKGGHTSRYVMPFIDGITAHDFISSTTLSLRDLADIILKIAQELQRIHKTGVIHGDLSYENIMIYVENDIYMVRFIDFGCATLDTDESILFFRGDDPQWHAPEVMVDNVIGPIKPNPNQDVYSLGFSLRKVLHAHYSYEELIQLFPSIKAFILKSQNKDPIQRPSLEEFCAQLSYDIHVAYNLSNKLSTHQFWSRPQQELRPEVYASQQNDAPESLTKGCCSIS